MYSEEKTLEEAVKDAVQYCIEKNILKEFLTKHATEVINMLFAEWNLNDAIAVAREEGFDDGVEEGIEKGIVKGRVEGIEQEKLIIARNLLMEGSTPDFIHKITGLDLETISGLHSSSYHPHI